MQKWRGFLHMIGIVAVSFLTVLVLQGGVQCADAATTTLDDGIYVVPAKIIKADSSATSSANQFFGDHAAVRVKDNRATVLLTSNGAQYIKEMTVDGQKATLVKTVNGQAIYQVGLTALTSPLPATFNLTTPMGKMQESARLVLTWAKAERDSDSTATADLISQATALTAKASSSQAVVPKATTDTAAKTTTPAAKTSKTTPTAQYWKYQVLKATAMTPSDANQYYTHTAKVTPTSQGYRVTLTVSYAKSLKLGAKAVVPKTMDGAAVPSSRVTYGQTAKAYTMTYWFPVKSTSSLTAKLIPGQIHVTVPVMNISETFPVRFRFAASGSADKATAAAVAALPKTTNKQATRTSAPARATAGDTLAAKRTLPATHEAPNTLLGWGLLGLMGAGGILWGAKRYDQHDAN